MLLLIQTGDGCVTSRSWTNCGKLRLARAGSTTGELCA
jgi:hypothetical protein